MKNVNRNVIAFRNGFILPNTNSSLDKQTKATIQSEIMQFGYILNDDAINNVTIEWYEQIVSYLKDVMGVGNYRPFYINFPTQVMEMSHTELFINAIIHYWSLGEWEPNQELIDRGIKFEHTTFTEIRLGSESEYFDVFNRLVTADRAIIDFDRNVIEYFVLNENFAIPNDIPFKETLALLVSLGCEVKVKNVTDVLRVAAHISGGSVSLINNVKFKISRKHRKQLLGMMENSSLNVGDMKSRIGMWLRLGEVLHPGEYKNRFPKTFDVFNKLRNDAKNVKSFQGIFDEKMKINHKDAIEFLSKRPGEFMRKLDYFVRNYESDIDFIMNIFEKNVPNVSRKVLWETYNHFNKRLVDTDHRIIDLKNGRKKKIDGLKALDFVIVDKIKAAILNIITKQIHFSDSKKMGSVWIDENLKRIPVPYSMRGINVGVKTLIRGTRVPINPDAKVIRSYVHWFDKIGDEDLDLSAKFVSKSNSYIDNLSYTNLKLDKFNSCHSGDVRMRKGACAEYVDIDLSKMKEHDISYALISVHNFQNKPMHSVKDAVFGFMEREYPESNQLFVPKTINNAIRLANEGTSIVACIIDFDNNDYIWVDMEANHMGINNILRTGDANDNAFNRYINNTDITVYDLIKIHVNAKDGIIVDNKDKADEIFEVDDYINSYEKIMELM